MLSKRLIETIGLRIKLMVLCGESIYDWDKKNSKLIKPNPPYVYWNWYDLIHLKFL